MNNASDTVSTREPQRTRPRAELDRMDDKLLDENYDPARAEKFSGEA